MLRFLEEFHAKYGTITDFEVAVEQASRLSQLVRAEILVVARENDLVVGVVGRGLAHAHRNGRHLRERADEESLLVHLRVRTRRLSSGFFGDESQQAR